MINRIGFGILKFVAIMALILIPAILTHMRDQHINGTVPTIHLSVPNGKGK